MCCPVCESPDGRPFQLVGDRAYGRCERCEATFLFPEHRPSSKAERAEYALHQNTEVDADYRTFLARVATPLLQRLPPGCNGLDGLLRPGGWLALMHKA